MSLTQVNSHRPVILDDGPAVGLHLFHFAVEIDLRPAGVGNAFGIHPDAVGGVVGVVPVSRIGPFGALAKIQRGLERCFDFPFSQP